MRRRIVQGTGGRRTVLVAHPGADLYGSDRIALETVGAMADAGWRVVVTVPETGPLVPAIEARGGLVELCPAPVLRRSALRPGGLVRLAAEAIRGLYLGNRLISRTHPAAIYVNTATIPSWLALARLRRIPVLCHVHEAEEEAPAMLRAALALPLFLADRVVANSEVSRRFVASAFPRLARRTDVILNGIQGPPVVTPAREQLTAPVLLVFVGRLSARKGVDVAVDAVRELVDRGVGAELDIVGAVFPGYEWYEAQLREQIESVGLSGRVRIRGFESDAWSRVEAADIALVPSRGDESFGNTAIEAVLCARPVVVSAVPGLVEATSGFASASTVTPGDPRALADAILETITKWADQRECALEDAAQAVGRHAPARYRERVAACVEALVGER